MSGDVLTVFCQEFTMFTAVFMALIQTEGGQGQRSSAMSHTAACYLAKRRIRGEMVCFCPATGEQQKRNDATLDLAGSRSHEAHGPAVWCDHPVSPTSNDPG